MKANGTTSLTVTARSKLRGLDHVPGESGLPIFGSTFRWFRAPRQFTFDMYERYGPIWRSNVFFETSVTFLGPDATEEILLDKEKNFSSRLGWHGLIGQLFGGGLMLLDFDEHSIHRRLMMEAFRKPALSGYLEVVASQMEGVVDEWLMRRNLAFYEAVKHATLDSSTAIFVGPGLDCSQPNRWFRQMVLAGAALFKVDLPGFAYHRGLRARERLVEWYQRVIEQRREEPGSDMVSLLVNSVGQDGQQLSDKQIVDHMVFMMMAAHDTTASALTMLSLELARNPEWQSRIREECLALDKRRLCFEDLPKLPLLEQAFKETLRLHPPVRVIPRRTVRDCTLRGTFLPANTTIWVNPEFNHRMPELWTRPDEFDPDRFSPERAEDKRHRLAWFPFSGGAHKCIGLAFSDIQVKALMFELLTRAEIRLAKNYRPREQLMPFPHASEGLPVELVARSEH